jgi:hypothetical protein
MLIKPRTLEDSKEDFILALRNNCGDKITKIAPLGVFNGFAYAMARLAQKINSDSALIESYLFPDFAYGTVLDGVSILEGFGARYLAIKGTVVLCFVATPGTTYANNFQVRNNAGVVYQTLNTLVIGACGFGFVIAESLQAGTQAKVSELSLTLCVTTPPAGHTSVTNTISSIGALDTETDYTYRTRIKNSYNIFAMKTELYYEALVRKFYPEVVRVLLKTPKNVPQGNCIRVLKNDGGLFDSTGLIDIKNSIADFLPITDRINNSITVENFDFVPIIIDFPVRFYEGTDPYQALTDLQLALIHFLDFSQWQPGKKVTKENLLDTCYKVASIKEINETEFSPDDIVLSEIQLPKLTSVSFTDLETSISYGMSEIPLLYLKSITDEQKFLESIVL